MNHQDVDGLLNTKPGRDCLSGGKQVRGYSQLLEMGGNDHLEKGIIMESSLKKHVAPEKKISCISSIIGIFTSNEERMI